MSDFATREMRFTRAESVLAAWLESDSGESIEDLCRLHSEIALELRELHLACSSLERPRAAGSQGAPAAGARPRGFEQATCRYADYTVGESFARGGMGEILEVRDEVLRRDLAMKRLRDDASLRGPGAGLAEHKLARFFAEARITSQLDHPGVVPVHELGFDPAGRPYFTMKRVRGRTLAEVFDLCARGDEAWSQTRVLGVLMRVCETMAYAHSRGVIHRDLKPANVMVGDFGEVYVMDWGLARAEREAAPERAGDADGAAPAAEDARELAPDSIQTRTLHGDVIGTPQYMPPEQATGQLERVGPTSDVYAVGAMLYQLLAGRAPYVELTRTLPAVALLSRVIAAPPEPIGAIAPRNTPPELIAICERAMQRDSARRYADMHELASDLRAYTEHRPGAAWSDSLARRASKWARRHPKTTVALLTIILCIAAAVILLVAPPRQP